jgi:selenide,water dikinase
MVDSNIIVGADTSDDAAVYKIRDDLALVQTVDYITPVVDDPYTFGEIAAANSISDIYAMGAKPLFALNIVGFPVSKAPMQVLESILKGGAAKAAEAGISILGGHSVDDEEPKYGLVVTGVVHPNKVIRNSTAQVGDNLILTKPIGTGIVNTAVKAELASEESMRESIRAMTTLNCAASEAMVKVGVNACTDVTGFGLLGHLHEMVEASGVGAKIDFSEIPVIKGVWDLVDDWIIPEGVHSNVEFVQEKLEWHSDLPEDAIYLLCDPQTSGGLLISTPKAKTDELIKTLTDAKVETIALVGEIIADKKNRIYVEFKSRAGSLPV